MAPWTFWPPEYASRLCRFAGMELEKFTGSPAHQGGVGSGATFWRLQHFGDVSMPVRGEKLLDG